MNSDVLKQALLELPHVQTVWFDEQGGWYFSPCGVTVTSCTREEILGKSESQEEVKKKK